MQLCSVNERNGSEKMCCWAAIKFSSPFLVFANIHSNLNNSSKSFSLPLDMESSSEYVNMSVNKKWSIQTLINEIKPTDNTLPHHFASTNKQAKQELSKRQTIVIVLCNGSSTRRNVLSLFAFIQE